MAIQSYIDEFKQNYEKPQVDGLIVGFSGIDPQRKSSGSSGSGSSCNCDNSNLSDAQKEIVLKLIREALSVIDFSDCNCDPSQLTDAQKSIIYSLIEQKINEINACNCDNSSLTQEQKDIVRQLIREAISVIDFSDCTCNPTQLSDEQKDIITRLIEQKIQDINVCNCDNSSLSNEQKEIVKETIDDRLRELDFRYDAGVIDNNNDNQPSYEPVNENNLDHEKLQNLLGGDNNGHFHLSNYELNKLRILINTFFIDDSDEVIIKPKLLNP